MKIDEYKKNLDGIDRKNISLCGELLSLRDFYKKSGVKPTQRMISGYESIHDTCTDITKKQKAMDGIGWWY